MVCGWQRWSLLRPAEDMVEGRLGAMDQRVLTCGSGKAERACGWGEWLALGLSIVARGRAERLCWLTRSRPKAALMLMGRLGQS